MKEDRRTQTHSWWGKAAFLFTGEIYVNREVKCGPLSPRQQWDLGSEQHVKISVHCKLISYFPTKCISVDSKAST